MPPSCQTDCCQAVYTSSLPQKKPRCSFERQAGIWQTPSCVIPNRKPEPPPKRWVSCLPTFDKTLLTNSWFSIIRSIITRKCSSEPIQASNSLQLLLKLMSQAISCKWVLFSNESTAPYMWDVDEWGKHRCSQQNSQLAVIPLVPLTWPSFIPEAVGTLLQFSRGLRVQHS